MTSAPALLTQASIAGALTPSRSPITRTRLPWSFIVLSSPCSTHVSRRNHTPSVAPVVRPRNRGRSKGMQDIDRPAHVQPLPQPARACCPRVETESLRIVLGFESAYRIRGHSCNGRHRRQEPPIWPSELERPAGLAIEPIALLVDRAVVPATEQREIRERRRATVGPVAHVMPLADGQPAAWKATAAVS